MHHFNRHPQEESIIAFCDSSQGVKPPIVLNGCQTIKDVQKFLKTQKNIIQARNTKEAYTLAIKRLKLFKNAIHNTNR